MLSEFVDLEEDYYFLNNIGAPLPSAEDVAHEKTVDKTSRDEIVSVPGFSGSFASRMWSGYLTVDSVLASHLFYLFVESERDPHNDPVVLWLNGGPGCSSFDGFVYEHGPFNFDYNHGDVKLQKNPYAWSKVANMIYLDSPVGVGHSYADKVDDMYSTDDSKTAIDLYTAVLQFFNIFPEFSSNRFFVSGESYAGIYVPLLTHLIATTSSVLGQNNKINLAGYLIGNGAADPKVDSNAYTPFARGKSLISKKFFDQITDACDGEYWKTYKGSHCLHLQRKMFRNELANLNPYNVAGTCEYPPEEITTNKNEISYTDRVNNFLTENDLVWPFGAVPATGHVHNWRTATNMEAPCLDFWTGETWMNNPEVRKAIHAAPLDVSGKYLICSDRIFYKKTIKSVILLHTTLVNYYEIPALIYSGDHDLAVPHTGTESWTSMMMGDDPEVPWQQWFSPENQVAGYVTESNGLIYCTVKNAGHMVPFTHPPQALDMFNRFIDNLSIVKPEPT